MSIGSVATEYEWIVYYGFSQADYAQNLVDAYKAAGVPASDVWPQSFNLEDVRYRIENNLAFGEQAVYLDDSYNRDGSDPMDPATFEPSMQELADMSVNYIAPPIWILVSTDGDEIVHSAYARAATEIGLVIIDADADYCSMLDALFRKVEPD